MDNEPKKEEIFLVEMKLDPIDAEVVLKNIGTKVHKYHELIENNDIEFVVEVKKSNRIGVVLKILGIAADIEGTRSLIKNILWFLPSRQNMARIAKRKFEFDVKINKIGSLRLKKSETYR